MSASASLIPELEDVIQHGSREKRIETLRRITKLFIDGAERFNEDHVRVFDDFLIRLIEEIERKARMELSNRLAPVDNAPIEVVRRLANDDDVDVAAPVLRRSPRLVEIDLVDIASSKSQGHLLAISDRKEIATPVTDVLVRRGDREVVRNVADNPKASLSEMSFASLVKRAEKDGILAEKVGLRPDIPAHLFRDLLVQATEVVQRRLLASAKPETQAEIRRVLQKVSSEVGAKTAQRDYREAQLTVLELHKARKLDEAALVEFAKASEYEEMVAGLSALCAVPIEVIDRLMGGDRPDPVLILCKARSFSWSTARAIILARPGSKATSSQGLDAAYGNFERLSPSTAQRVLRFWQVRQADNE
jgi:uncharacterized protein (DUF2336 family)